MSYASETKNELARIEPEKKCCMLAEITGFMRFAGSVGFAGGGKFRMVMTTPNLAVVRHYKKLIRSYFSVDTDIEIGSTGRNARGLKGAKAKEYIIRIEPENNSEMILREMGILIVRGGVNTLSDGIYDGIIRTKCCRKAYMRGMFLGTGTISDPLKSYHLEYVCDSEVLAKDLRHLIRTFDDLSAKIVPRKDKFIVYMKNSQYISDTLAIMGAHSGVLQFEDVKIQKGLVSEAVRITNCDNANTDRTLDASQRQVEAIKKIQAIGGLDSLSEKLRELALLRLYNPEASLTQLGEMMSPPLKKSGVNNRMKRILDFAARL